MANETSSSNTIIYIVGGLVVIGVILFFVFAGGDGETTETVVPEAETETIDEPADDGAVETEDAEPQTGN
ncbi:hypothetical protein AAD018_010560 [Aestuariibius insulae]|uniref:hypothetical protein n=1 Tax=Aestuariibius insulae TaxID=2058287 RepID=UPI00345E47E6